MRVLLVAEGRHELSGALETLIRRLGLSDAEISQDIVSSKKIHAHHGTGQGYYKRAVRWMLTAEALGYDALVLVIDEDRIPERLKELAEAQNYSKSSIRRALGVAIRTFDAWMLADERALKSVLGCHVDCQPDPEKLSDPKRACGKLLGDSPQTMKLRDMYTGIAGAVDIQLLKSRCPTGFAPFAARVERLRDAY